MDRTPAAVDSKGTRYRFAGWELSLRTRHLTSPTGASLELTVGELSLLTAFLQIAAAGAEPRAATHRHASRRRAGIDRSIDVQILRLRRKLDFHPTAPELIKTERGVGYVFTVSVQTF